MSPKPQKLGINMHLDPKRWKNEVIIISKWCIRSAQNLLLNVGCQTVFVDIQCYPIFIPTGVDGGATMINTKITRHLRNNWRHFNQCVCQHRTPFNIWKALLLLVKFSMAVAATFNFWYGEKLVTIISKWPHIFTIFRDIMWTVKQSSWVVQYLTYWHAFNISHCIVSYLFMQSGAFFCHMTT